MPVLSATLEDHGLMPAWPKFETPIPTNKLDIVVCICNSNFIGNARRKIMA
jgi:hypothetical protein